MPIYQPPLFPAYSGFEHLTPYSQAVQGQLYNWLPSPAQAPLALGRGAPGTGWEAAPNLSAMMNQSGLSPANPTVRQAVYNQIPTPQLALGPGSPAGGLSTIASNPNWQSAGVGPTFSAGRPAAGGALVPFDPAAIPTRNTDPAMEFLSTIPKSTGVGALRSPVTVPTLAGTFPNFTAANAATSAWGKLGGAGFGDKGRLGGMGGNIAKTAARGAVGSVANFGIQAADRAAFGDTVDPTNPLSAFTRGFGGGVAAGSTFGVPGAIVGGLGAGLGNAAGYALTGGNAHLGNVPVVGGLFGGGGEKDPNAAFAAKYGVDPGKLTDSALKSKLDSYKFAPELRTTVRDAFNRDVADLRSRDIPNEEAMAQTYKAYFIGDDKTPPKALQYRDGQLGSDQANANGPAMQNAMALAALMAKYAPDLSPDLSQFRAIRDDALSNLSGDMRGFAAASGQDIEGRVLQQAADQGAIFANLPLQIAQAAMAADKAKYDAAAMELEKARISAGNSTTPLPAE